MIGFAIFRNGERVCTAAVQDGVLSATLASVTREAEIRLDVGGLQNGEHLQWANLELHVGDEVTLRVVDCTAGDEPASRYRDDPQQVRRAKRRLIKQYQAELSSDERTV